MSWGKGVTKASGKHIIIVQVVKMNIINQKAEFYDISIQLASGTVIKITDCIFYISQQYL